MGDRASVYVMQHSENGPGPGVFLYTHWDGNALPKILQDALIRGRSRWNDEPHLTRIIVCEMIDKKDWNDLRGFGISTHAMLNDRPALIVNCSNGTVGVALAPEPGEMFPKSPTMYKEVSFLKFIEMADHELKTFREQSLS